MEFLVSDPLASDLILWRICNQKLQDTAFSGVGGTIVSGRWHTKDKGCKVVYTAESLALATLEVFVHIQSDRIPLIAIRAHIPKGEDIEEVNIEEVNIQNLPPNWQKVEAYPKLQ